MVLQIGSRALNQNQIPDRSEPEEQPIDPVGVVAAAPRSSFWTFDNCTAQQRETTSKQINEEIRLMSLTACPSSRKWLEDFYLMDRAEEDTGSFLAVHIGCSYKRSYDSLNLLRMGTRDESIRKKDWAPLMDAPENSANAVCGDDNRQDLFVVGKQVKGDVHCVVVESNPAAIESLRQASKSTGMERKGLHIVQQDPPMTTLDQLETKHMHMTSNAGQTINVLLIDTEGYDVEAMMGDSKTLDRVEYLEFESHTIGSWGEQKTRQAIDYLDEKSFACYWAGRQRLWRVSKCWQDHFGEQSWSNLVCAHRGRKPELARKMEVAFLRAMTSTM